MAPLRVLVRWIVSILIVSLPLSWLLYQWRWEDDQVLVGASYQRFNEALASQKEPALWTYALWIFLVVLCVVALVHLVHGVLKKVFPHQVITTR